MAKWWVLRFIFICLHPNTELPGDHFARPFVIQMIAHKPEDRISLSKVIEYLKPLQPSPKLSLLQYDLQNLLSSTGTISLVYDVGTFEGSVLAVKRVPIKDCTTKPFDELKQLNHSNIIRLLLFDEDDVYKFVRNCFIIFLLRLRNLNLIAVFIDILGWNCAWHLWTNFSFQKTTQRNIQVRFRLTSNFVSNLSVDCSTFTEKGSSTGQSNPPTFWYRPEKIHK